MREGQKLAETRLDDEARKGRCPLVSECQFIQVGHEHRVYYLPEPDEGHGFRFIVLEWLTNDMGDETWGPSCEVTILLRGYALFDGVRHMWWTPTDECGPGYMNYPSMAALRGVVEALGNLEGQHCGDFGGRSPL